MKDKELIEQLNTLKDVKPDSTWKSANRSVLMNQIYGAEDRIESKDFNLFKSFFKTLPRFTMDLAGQPTMVVVFIFLLVFGGSAISLHFAHDTKPGDSLYIAKIINERAKETFTFNDKDKTQLVIKHARNRAEELNQALAESTYDGEKIEKLAGEAKKEINKARTRLKKINTNIAKNNIDNSDSNNTAVDKQGNKSDAEPLEVFSANSSKDDTGMQVAETEVAKKVTPEEGDGQLTEQETKEKVVPNTLDILDQADVLLTGDNYGATLDKLDEANLSIEKSIVKEAPASSSEEVVIDESETDIASSTEE